MMRLLASFLAICCLALLVSPAAAQTLVGQIPVPPLFVTDLAVNPFTGTVYVTSSNPGELSVLDGRTRSVVDTIQLGFPQAQSVAVNFLENRVYVGVHDIGTGNSSVVVISGRSRRVLHTIYLSSGGGGLVSIAVDPLRNRVYVADANNWNLTIIDGRTNRILATVDLGIQPASVSVNTITNRIYVVGNSAEGQLLVINGRTGAVSQAIAVGQRLSQVAVDEANNHVFLLAPGNDLAGEPGTIYAVNGTTNSLITTIQGFDTGIAVDPLRNILWAVGSVPSDTGHPTGIVALIDARTNAILSTASIPDFGRIAVDPVTDTGYVLGVFGEVDVLSGRDVAQHHHE